MTASATRPLPPHGSPAPATRISGHPGNCPCDDCTQLRARYQKQRRIQQHRGTWETLTDAAPAITLLREYIAAGWTERQIGYVAGIAPHYIGRLLNPGDTRAATARIRPATAAAIRSLAHGDRFDAAVPDTTYLDPTGSIRRLQSLACGNWSRRNLRTRYGAAIVRFVDYGCVRAGVARVIRDAYEELWNIPGPSPTAAAWARRNGWVPAAAWEHLDIDDPRAVPDLGAAADPTVALVENAEWFHDEHGLSWESAAERLGVRRNTLHTYRSRVRERAAASAGGAS